MTRVYIYIYIYIYIYTSHIKYQTYFLKIRVILKKSNVERKKTFAAILRASKHALI